MKEISGIEAQGWFCRLPMSKQLATLAPEYVFADSQRDNRLTPIFLIYREEKSFWLLSAHISHVPNSEYLSISSPYGYGGPLSNTNDVDFNDRAWESYRRWAHEHLILAELMKLHPLVEHQYRGQCKFNRWVYTAGTKYWPNCLNKVRKADRSGLAVLEFSRSAIADRFRDGYYDAMKRVKADSFYFFDEAYFRAVGSLNGACLLVCQDKDERWLSASIMLAGALTMESHLTFTTDAGRKVGATNYLTHQARSALNERSDLYLGGGKTESEDDPLSLFKASFGGKRLPFYIGWQIHRPDVYREMKQGITSDRVLWWL